MPNSIVWDKTGERLFESGIDHAVLYPIRNNNGSFGGGVPWNGLISVSQDVSGGEVEGLFFDGIKYFDNVASDGFQATLTAYTYPEEFSGAEGLKKLGPGMYIPFQTHQVFALSYRTKLSRANGSIVRYRLHMIYNCTVASASKAVQTDSETVNPSTFSWTINATPTVPGSELINNNGDPSSWRWPAGEGMTGWPNGPDGNNPIPGWGPTPYIMTEYPVTDPSPLEPIDMDPIDPSDPSTFPILPSPIQIIQIINTPTIIDPPPPPPPNSSEYPDYSDNCPILWQQFCGFEQGDEWKTTFAGSGAAVIADLGEYDGPWPLNKYPPSVPAQKYYTQKIDPENGVEGCQQLEFLVALPPPAGVPLNAIALWAYQPESIGWYTDYGYAYRFAYNGAPYPDVIPVTWNVVREDLAPNGQGGLTVDQNNNVTPTFPGSHLYLIWTPGDFQYVDYVNWEYKLDANGHPMSPWPQISPCQVMDYVGYPNAFDEAQVVDIHLGQWTSEPISNVDATGQYGDPGGGGRSLWWVYKPAVDGYATFDTLQSTGGNFNDGITQELRVGEVDLHMVDPVNNQPIGGNIPNYIQALVDFSNGRGATSNGDPYCLIDWDPLAPTNGNAFPVYAGKAYYICVTVAQIPGFDGEFPDMTYVLNVNAPQSVTP